MDQRQARSDSLLKARWLAGIHTNCKIIFTPSLFSEIVHNALSIDYYREADSNVFVWDVTTCDTGGVLDWANKDSVVKSYRIDASVGAADTDCMATRTRYAGGAVSHGSEFIWGNAYTGFSGDLDGSGTETLFVRGEGGIDHGKPLLTPLLHFFHGNQNGRWGRGDISRKPTWTWYSNRDRGTIGFVDQNADGNLDFVEYGNQTGIGVYGSITVTYGKSSGYFDTNDIETVRFDSVHGHISMFADITGDAAPAAPELLVNTGDDNTCRIYAGKRGQRLEEQFGSGDDPPSEGKGWWRRPWAVIWLAGKLDDAWGGSGYTDILDLGDGNLDGIGDIWLHNEELLLGYVSGNRLDSLIDAMVSAPYHDVLSISNLGDIDGSGIPTIAMSYDEFPSDYQHPFNGGVMFVKPSDEVPSTGGTYRKLPQEISSASELDDNSRMLELRAVPNPSDGRVVVLWKSMQGGVLIISDALGRETIHVALDAATQEYVWDTSHLVAGTYFISLEVDHRLTTTRISVL